MTISKRYPGSYTLLVGVSGAAVCSLPFLMLPFIPLIFPLIRMLPDYPTPPYTIKLPELFTSFILGGLLAGGIFLLGVRRAKVDEERQRKLAVTRRVTLATLTGITAGAALACLVGFGYGYSGTGRTALSVLGDYYHRSELGLEPAYSLGAVLGVGLGAAVICLLSGTFKEALGRRMLAVSLMAAGAALLGRVLVYMIQFSSIVTYSSLGESVLFLIGLQAAAGALSGAIAWKACTAGRWEAAEEQNGKY
jgi:hypothetical protein